MFFTAISLQYARSKHDTQAMLINSDSPVDQVQVSVLSYYYIASACYLIGYTANNYILLRDKNQSAIVQALSVAWIRYVLVLVRCAEVYFIFMMQTIVVNNILNEKCNYFYNHIFTSAACLLIIASHTFSAVMRAFVKRNPLLHEPPNIKIGFIEILKRFKSLIEV